MSVGTKTVWLTTFFIFFYIPLKKASHTIERELQNVSFWVKYALCKHDMTFFVNPIIIICIYIRAS